jgi:hypothetical protein
LPVLIEDKVWAVFQDRQPERYARRARARNGVAVLVAPASFLPTHAEQREIFDGVAMLEELAAHIRARPPGGDTISLRRARWRARLLEEVIRPRSPTPAADDPNTVAFTEFCTSWPARHAPEVVPNPRSNHTRGQGWLWFESPFGLAYKASGWARKPRAGVDLYVGEHGFTGTAEERSSNSSTRRGSMATSARAAARRHPAPGRQRPAVGGSGPTGDPERRRGSPPRGRLAAPDRQLATAAVRVAFATT